MTLPSDGTSPKGRKVPKLRVPRAKTPHPCLICADPVSADSPENALHPDCKIDARKCSQCGKPAAIPHPDCTGCGGTGAVADSACPFCPPAPCAPCAMKAFLAVIRQERDRRDGFGNCPRCGTYTGLNIEPMCRDCFLRDEADWAAWEAA